MKSPCPFIGFKHSAKKLNSTGIIAWGSPAGIVVETGRNRAKTIIHNITCIVGS